MTTRDFPALSFAALLKRHRREQGLSQQQLAIAACYTSGYVSMLERGERAPLATTAEHLAAALNLAQNDADEFYAAARRTAELARERERAQHTATLDEYGPSLPVGGLLGARPDGPLVARAAEFAFLDAALEAVLGGVGRMVVLAGEPGVGKTRLAQEVVLRARARGVAVATGCCYEHLGTVALAPFVEALAHLYTFVPPAMRDEVRRRWPVVVRLLPDASGPEGAPTAMSMTDGQQRLFWQVSGFVRAVAEVRSVALLLDDLHWADEASLDLLQHLARQTRGARVLLLGTYRDTEVRNRRALRAALHELRRERLLELLTLHALTAEGTADLLSALLGGADGADERVAEALVEQIQQATGGLPLFVQEVVHSLQERGEMDRRNGQWTRRTSGELDVSETVRDAIGARIERLRPETQAMLEEGSVLGQVFDVAPLQRMGAHAEAEVEAALEEALQAGLIEETARRGAHGVAYSFRHALRQRAVYTAIPSLRRRRLHRAAAEALEAVHEGKRSMPAATLAWHFLEGDAVARALPYSLKAGDQAEEVYAHAEAERHYRLAAELARELGGQPCEAEAYQKLGALCDNLGRFDEAIAALEQAARGYRMLGDRERLARATHHLVRALHRAGRITEGVGHLQALVVFLTSGGADEPSERHPDLAGPRAARALDTLAPAAAALIGSNMAVYLATLGRAVEALSVIEEATAHARIAGDVQVQVLAHYMRGNILRDLGRLDDAERAWQESSTLAREAGSLDFRAIALSNRGLAQVAHGDLAQARVLYVQALEVGTQLGDPYLVAWSRGDIAELAFIGGDWGQARTALETTLEAVRVRPPGASRAVGLTYGAGMPLALLGRLDLAEGRTEEGLLALGQVLRLSESSTASGILPWAQQALAEYDLLAGEPEAARRRLEPMFAAHGSRESALPATLAWALLELGARDQAQQVVEATTAVARARRLRLVLVEALRIQGLVALRGERWSEAEKAVEEPLALCREMGYPYAEAKARYVYGQLDAARGEREPARQHFAAALAILRRLGERLYAEHVERALAALPGVGQQEG